MSTPSQSFLCTTVTMSVHNCCLNSTQDSLVYPLFSHCTSRNIWQVTTYCKLKWHIHCGCVISTCNVATCHMFLDVHLNIYSVIIIQWRLGVTTNITMKIVYHVFPQVGFCVTEISRCVQFSQCNRWHVSTLCVQQV